MTICNRALWNVSSPTEGHRPLPQVHTITLKQIHKPSFTQPDPLESNITSFERWNHEGWHSSRQSTLTSGRRNNITDPARFTFREELQSPLPARFQSVAILRRHFSELASVQRLSTITRHVDLSDGLHAAPVRSKISELQNTLTESHSERNIPSDTFQHLRAGNVLNKIKDSPNLEITGWLEGV
ncbi:uncharacterized protein MYCFIDRAFT_175993 [Pseudocercospora fijiensis CIRAD86]|uniref:Uncharacterized protein n=1 Tax=Pseudocercospora fijiensis (strain CIRAD86) TaxID=383855 RepID=M2YXL7_PSEFD|nr:uncharacterized protein MYCFIDRAFT_175993 [Pseudocercospora fijiensis CIRAD86]EME82445.1 hypothetical protein MYCFIDRAFT_175993 [Pseudocercospora fijiensis CIRAD86]